MNKRYIEIDSTSTVFLGARSDIVAGLGIYKKKIEWGGATKRGFYGIFKLPQTLKEEDIMTVSEPPCCVGKDL